MVSIKFYRNIKYIDAGLSIIRSISIARAINKHFEQKSITINALLIDSHVFI